MADIQDYGLDPYQAQEDELRMLEQLAVQKLLRRPPQGQVVSGVLVGGPTFASGLMDTVDKYQGEQELKSAAARRKALGEQSQRDMQEALAAGTPEALMAHPALRDIGRQQMKSRYDRKMQREDDEAFQKMVGMGAGVGGEAGAGGPSLDQLLVLKESSNKKMAEWAKSQIETYFPKAAEAGKAYPQRGTGEYAAIPGALKAAGDVERQKRELEMGTKYVEVPYIDPVDGRQKTRRMSELDYARSQGYGAPSPQGGAVGVGLPPNGETGVRPASALPGTMSVAGGGTPTAPADQNLIRLAQQTLSDQYAHPKARQKAAEILDKAGVQFETQSGRGLGMSAPVAQAPQQAQTPQLGISDPEGAKFREVEMQAASKAIAEGRATFPKAISALKTVQQMDALNQGGQLIDGPIPAAQLAVMRAWGNITGDMSDRVSMSELYNKLNLTQLRDSLKAYGSGTGISNLDLLTAMKTLPGLENTSQGRAMILEFMQGDMMSTIQNQIAAEEYFKRNHTLNGFQPQNYDKQGNVVTQEQMKEKMAEFRKMGEFRKRAEATLPDAQREMRKSVLGDTLRSMGEGAYGLATGEPEAWGNFGTGAGLAGATMLGGPIAGRAAAAALPAIGRWAAQPQVWCTGGALYGLMRYLNNQGGQ
jgi:hypothetical protein